MRAIAWRNNKDLLAGLMFVAIGVAAMIIGRDYRLGSPQLMGPGYFPRILSWVLIGFGIAIAVRGLRRPEAIQAAWSPRALFVLTLSVVLFGVLILYAGFVPALVVLIFGSASASKSFKAIEVLLLTLLLTALSIAVFIWGLGLPYPLIKGV